LEGVPAATERDLTRLARAFRALGDETRLRLLELLREGEQCVCDLTDALGAAQPLLSFHLRTLKEAGLVADRREGRWVYYSLTPRGLDEVGRCLLELKPAGRPGMRRCQ
jgi:ArsR family transcriptional regulator